MPFDLCCRRFVADIVFPYKFCNEIVVVLLARFCVVGTTHTDAPYTNIVVGTDETPWPGSFVFCSCALVLFAPDLVTQSTGSLKAKMPFGQVPALELDDGSFIAQSLSIARYLGVKLHLSGHDQVAHARVDSLLQTIDEMRQPASSAYWNKDKQKMEDWKAKVTDYIVDILFYCP